MAPQEYDFEMRQQAHDLYVIGGLTFAQVAQATGVSESQLKRWSAEEREWAERRGEADPKDWPDLRKEFRLSQSSATRQAVVLRALLISNALSSKGEFKTVLSAAMWEKTQGRGGEPQAGRMAGGDACATTPAAPAPGEALGMAGGDACPTALQAIKTTLDAVSALEDIMARRINLMATQPGLLTFAAIKDLKQTLGLMEELKTKYRPEAGAGQTAALSDETIRLIQEKLLGTG